MLCIDLQGGFKNDEVRISVDGRVVFQQRDVTTKLLLELAATTQVPFGDGKRIVEVAVPTRGLSRSDVVEISDEIYLGVNLEGAELRLNWSQKPFGYA